MKITLCGIYYNEAERLKKLIPIVKPYVDEIVCVVQKSDDDTEKVMLDFGAIVLPLDNIGFSEAQRGHLMKYVKTEWVFYLDADEVPTEQLLSDLKSLVSDNYDAYNLIWENKLDNQLLNCITRFRLFKKSVGYSEPFYLRQL